MIATSDIDWLCAQVTKQCPAGGLVTVDGVTGAGKTTLASQIAMYMDASWLDLDAYLHRNQDCFFLALDLPALTRRIAELPRPLIVAGCCMLQVLQALGATATVTIYVKRMCPWGWPDYDSMYGTEVEDFQARGIQASRTHLEVRQYHRAYRPDDCATFVYERPVA